MNISYNLKIAKKYGKDEAIILNDIAYWIKENKKHNRNNKEGFFWTYNTYEYFADFVCVSTKSIQRIINKLESLNIIKVSNFNKMKNDHTKWYTIIDSEVLSIYEIELNPTEHISQPLQSKETTKYIQSSSDPKTIAKKTSKPPLHNKDGSKISSDQLIEYIYSYYLKTIESQLNFMEIEYEFDCDEFYTYIMNRKENRYNVINEYEMNDYIESFCIMLDNKRFNIAI